MSLAYHQLPAGAFDALIGGGAAMIGLLKRSQYSKHALLLRGLGEHAPTAYDLLARAQRKDPDAVRTVVQHPSVGAWAYRASLALRGVPSCPGASPDGLANVAAAAAIRAGLQGEAPVSASRGQVILPSLGAADVPEDATTATVRITPEAMHIRAASRYVTIPLGMRAPAAGWRPLRPVLSAADGMAAIVVDDIDPFRMPAAPQLTTAPDLSRWVSAFANAWDLLQLHHSVVAAEVAAMVTVAVPLATPPHGQVSSSSPEAFGAIAMSEPVDARSLAVTLAHEVQHIKLSAVLDMLPLTRPDDGSRYYAPWREDPRPASGLLQGTYAYIGVTRFWRRQRAAMTATDSVADTEFARWRDAVSLGCATLLGSGQLTADGDHFVRTMAAALRPWQDEFVPDRARREAEEQNQRHRARWERRYGPASAIT